MADNLKHICGKCNKEFSTVSLRNRHMNKQKIPCNVEDRKQYISNKKKCQYCEKVLCTYNNLRSHENICKSKPKSEPVNINILEVPNKEEEMEIMKMKFEELIKQMEIQNKQWQEQQNIKWQELQNKLIEKIQNIDEKNKSHIQDNSNNINSNCNSNNNNSNNVIGNINNFNIIAYGKETCEHISDNMFKQIIDKGFKSVPYLVEQIHFNKDKPENHNVYISNMRDNYALVYDGTKWILNEKEAILEDIMDAKSYLLTDKYSELKYNSEDYASVKFERFLSECDTSIVKEQMKEDIKLSLYNNKAIPEATKKQVNKQIKH